MASSPVAYNPSDPAQQGFLASLGLGESGGASNPYEVGYSGVDLSGAPTDAYGFPQWSGVGDSHAAGAYQFEPSTWDAIAAQYGLNFQNPADQNAGAWYLAQQTYGAKTGGSLEDALNQGNFSGISTALAGVWPSVGNASFTNTLTGEANGTTPVSAGPGGWIQNLQNFMSGVAKLNPVTAVQDTFTRAALLVVGGIIILVALWQLLSSTGVVPSPGDAAKTAAKVAAA